MWEEFVQSSSDIDELTEVVSSWVAYCEDTVIPKKVVKIYPNNKPWVRKQLKYLLKKKKLAFRQNNLQELHSIQKEIKREIKRAKWDYKLKVEHKLSNNLLGSAWDSIKTMVGQNDKKKKKVSLEGFTSDISLAQELNLFYSRFDKHDFSNEIVGHKQFLLSHPQSTVCFSAQSVVNTFKYCKAKTSPGPDNIGSRCNVYRQEFNCLHVTERISVSLKPPPLERARWLSDLGYGLLQALMALGYIPRGYLKPLLCISAKARDFVRSQNKEKWPLEDFQETHSFHDNNSSTQGTCGY